MTNLGRGQPENLTSKGARGGACFFFFIDAARAVLRIFAPQGNT